MGIRTQVPVPGHHISGNEVWFQLIFTKLSAVLGTFTGNPHRIPGDRPLGPGLQMGKLRLRGDMWPAVCGRES